VAEQLPAADLALRGQASCVVFSKRPPRLAS
jgi:hypothetical protein